MQTALVLRSFSAKSGEAGLGPVPPAQACFSAWKGLYLRNVDGKLWLRGYICDAAYRFPGDALFAFEAINE